MNETDQLIEKYEQLIERQLKQMTVLTNDAHNMHRILSGLIHELIDLVFASITMMEKDSVPSALVLDVIGKHIDELKKLYPKKD